MLPKCRLQDVANAIHTLCRTEYNFGAIRGVVGKSLARSEYATEIRNLFNEFSPNRQLVKPDGGSQRYGDNVRVSGYHIYNATINSLNLVGEEPAAG